MATKLEAIEQFLINPQNPIDYPYLVIALIISALLSYVLARLYTKFGTSISNRKQFSSNFILIAATTTLIITIVKSSLALSLGLVGALSIIRFRTAIKEPEELAFLFLTIAIGLGLGAGQFLTTIIAFAVISLLIGGRYLTHKKEENQNLYLTISDSNISLEEVVAVLKKNCSIAELKRFDKSKDQLEASFFVELSSYEKLEKIKKELEALSKTIKIAYLSKPNIN